MQMVGFAAGWLATDSLAIDYSQDPEEDAAGWLYWHYSMYCCML